MSIKGNVLATYQESGDPGLIDYYPAWVGNLEDDATLEASLLDDAVQGAEAVRSIVVTIRSLYDRQEHRSAGPYGDNGFLEDYSAQVRGEPIGRVVLVTRNGRRADPARRGELPATELAAALVRARGSLNAGKLQLGLIGR